MADDDAAGAPRRRTLFAVVLALAAVLVPLLLAGLAPGILAASYGPGRVAFELFGFCAAAALAAFGWAEWRADSARPLGERLVLLAPLLLGLHYAFLIGEYAQKPYDYDCYEYAGRALLADRNPYVFGLNYLYPPLTAQSFAAVHRMLGFAAGALGLSADGDAIWDAVFYLYQCAQLGLILLLYALGVRFARGLGFAGPWVPLLVAALLLFDNPLLRTLRHGQVNLWILDLSLVALLCGLRRPALAGGALALAVHVKLYPAVLVLPLALAGCWRAAAWAAAGVVAIVGIQTRGFVDWTPWIWFADFYASVFPGEVAFRNNSFHSLVHNTLRLVVGLPPESFRGAVRLASSGVSAAAAAWLVCRTWRRSRAAADAPRSRTLLENGADALAFSLLISQSVWEHHYVLAIPLVLHAAARRWGDRPGTVLLAALLMLGLPTIDLFPVSYHRVVGLLLALVLVAPERGNGGDTRGSPRGATKDSP